MKIKVKIVQISFQSITVADIFSIQLYSLPAGPITTSNRKCHIDPRVVFQMSEHSQEPLVMSKLVQLLITQFLVKHFALLTENLKTQ